MLQLIKIKLKMNIYEKTKLVELWGETLSPLGLSHGYQEP